MLNIDLYNLRDELQTRAVSDTPQIFCVVRRRWVVLEPEEIVRQLFLTYCMKNMHYPRSLISVEKAITVNDMTRRYDVVLHDRKAAPFILIECKAPSIALDQSTLHQVAQYNSTLVAPYLVITNGRASYGFLIDHDLKSFTQIDSLPNLPEP